MTSRERKIKNTETSNYRQDQDCSVGSSSDGCRSQCDEFCTVTAFPELPGSIIPQHPVTRDAKGTRDIPGDYKLLPDSNAVAQAEEKLNQAPSLSSLVSSSTDSCPREADENVPVSSAGCQNLSSAHISPDTSNRSCGPASESGSQAQIMKVPGEGDEYSKDGSISSSYMLVSVQSLADVFGLDSYSTHIQNNLDTSRSEPAAADAMAKKKKNISPGIGLQNTSIEDNNKTSSWTQTNPPPDQDQDSVGGAAAASSFPSASSGSSSSMPSDSTLIENLRRPIVCWLMQKLETQIGAGWQDLADRHGWNYQEITDFENCCKMKDKSPFLCLLKEPAFQMYNLGRLKDDLKWLPRKDILYALEAKLKEYYM